MQESFRSTWVEIDLEKLLSNLQVLRNLNGADFFCPVVKANAYGHEDQSVLQALQAADVHWIAVGLVEEALRARRLGWEKEILVFGVIPENALEACESFRLTPTLCEVSQIPLLKQNRRISWHLKLNTGMNRLGLSPKEFEDSLEQLKAEGSRIQGLMTHLWAGEELETTSRQLKQFQDLSRQFSSPRFVHALNTAGLGQKSSLGKLAESLGSRPGLGLYGESSLPSLARSLRPVMSFKSRFVRIFRVGKGEGVSYDHTWKAPRPSRIGVLPVGYADGYPRHLSNRGWVLVNSQRVPIVGRVCMDYVMVDITELPEGEKSLMKSEVLLWGSSEEGPSLSVMDLARVSDSIAWELLACVSPRVPRFLRGAPGC